MSEMRMIAVALGASSAMALAAACAAPQAGAADRLAAGSFSATAQLRTAEGADAGAAVIREHGGALMVTVSAKGLAAGLHGAHVHTTGKCDAPDFTTAGGHWNPTAKQHGTENPAGPHAGDAPNIEIGADGSGTLERMLPAGSFEQLLDEDGAAFVIHAGPDDMKTDPSGNSGARIACGVFAAD